MAELLQIKDHRQRKAGSKDNLRSRSGLALLVAVARDSYDQVLALEAERDEALYRSLWHCAWGIEEAEEHPDAWREFAGSTVKGREIATQFIDFVTKRDGRSTLNDERRATYAAAAQFLSLTATEEFEDIERCVARLREVGGVDEAAYAYRHRDGHPSPPSQAWVDDVLANPSRYTPGARECAEELTRLPDELEAVRALYREVCWANTPFKTPPLIWDDTDKMRMAIIAARLAQEREAPDTRPRPIHSRGDVAVGAADISASHAEPPEPQIKPLGRDNEVEIRPEFARRVIEHYRPSGKCLDMCRGQIGGFFDALPRVDRHFCEISLGRDFFDWSTNCDWIFGNPPWGDVYEDFLRHALSLAPHVVILSRLDTALNSRKRHDVWRFSHGLHPVIVVRWEDAFVGTKAGWTLGLFHFERGFVSEGWVYWD